jgi:hypothetical protein
MRLPDETAYSIPQQIRLHRTFDIVALQNKSSVHSRSYDDITHDLSRPHDQTAPNSDAGCSAVLVWDVPYVSAEGWGRTE